MDFENEVAGISASITDEDTAGALSHDDQIATTIEVAEDHREYDQSMAALEHLYVSIESLITLEESGEPVSPETAALIVEPTNISVESLAANTLQAIKDFIATCIRIGSDIVARIKRWADNIKALLPSVLKSIKDLRAKLDTLPANQTSPTHTNPAGLARLAVNNLVPRDSHQVMNGLSNIIKTATVIYGTYAPEILALEEKINDVLEDAGSKTNGADYLNDVNDVMLKQRIINRKLFKFDREDGDFSISSSELLPGNKRVVAQWPSVKALQGFSKLSNDARPFEMAKILQRLSVRLESTVTDDVSLVPKAELFKTMDKQEMILVLDACAGMLGIYDDFNNQISPKLKEQIERSLRVLLKNQALKNAPTKVDGTVSMTEARYMKAIVSYHNSISKWASEPFSQYAAHILDIINACLRLVRVSISQYA